MANNMGPMAGRQQAIKSESVGPMAMQDPNKDPRIKLNTFIYDYFLKIRQPDLASEMLKKNNDLGIMTKNRTKTSPSGRDVNGINDAMDSEPKDDIAKRIETMPLADLGTEQLPHESFLQDWFGTFWDVWWATKPGGGPNGTNTAALQYLSTNRLGKPQMMSNIAMGNRMMAQRMNGASLQKQAMNNVQMGNRMGFPGAQIGQQGLDGQRPQSPSMAGDNAPSPSKRQRLGEGFPGPGMAGHPNGPGQMPNGQPNMGANGINPQQDLGLMGDMMDQRIPNAQGGALADYQMQLMLLEQQNKRRLLMARQEQEVVAQGGPPGATSQPGMMGPQSVPGFVQPGMSPRRAGQSPNPPEGLKRNASQMGQSPRPDGLNGTRSSPAPGMFDQQNPQMPGHQQFFPGQVKQMGPAGMMAGNMAGNMAGFPGANGQMKPAMGGMPRPGMPPGGQFNPQMNPHFAQNPQQHPPQNPNNPQGQQGNQPPNSMPPPNAPNNSAAGRTNPSSPAPPPAPPTPSQNKNATAKGKKNNEKKDPPKGKQQTKKTGATPSSEAHNTPPPSTPVTPHPPPNALTGKNGVPANNAQQQAGPNGVQPQVSGQPQADMNSQSAPDDMPDQTAMNPLDDIGGFDNFGSTDVLEGFDFDSFLHVDAGQDQFGFDPNSFLAPDTMETGLTENQ